MKDLVSDLRFAVRMLAKNPGFTAVAILALALGIGANTAIFSVVNAVLLRSLPFDSPERLVSVESFSARNHREDAAAASYPDFQDFRSQSRSFEGMAAYHDDTWALTGAGRQATNLNIVAASADLFSMLGAKPLMGRTFRTDEDENVAASPMTVILSERAWRRHFGSDPGIIGKPVTLQGRPFTVVGVMPASFNFPINEDPYDAWTTFAFSGDLKTADGSHPMGTSRGSHYLEVIAKLKPGIRAAEAKSDLEVLVENLGKKYPDSNSHRGIRVRPVIDRLTGKLRPVLLVLLGAVACVLLVACANVANLLLARASTRHRELAIRMALGAGRARMIRQVLTESVLLSIGGGLAGLLVGLWSNDLLIRFGPGNVPRLGETRVDLGVFAFAMGVSLLTGIVFGLVPAFRASQSDPADSLKEGSRGTTEGLRSNKARSALVVCEVALSLVLLACAGLLLRSLGRLTDTDPGFRPSHVLSASITLPPARYRDVQVTPFFDELEARLSRLPGVASVGDVLILPLSGNDMSTSFEAEGHPVAKSERPSTRVNIASPNYFRTMGIPLRAGRDFTASDKMGSNYVAIVDEAFARRFLPGVNPIGKRIQPGISDGEKTTPFREIVGVVGSVEQDRIGQNPLPEVFIPHAQLRANSTVVVIHTRNDTASALAGLRTTLSAMDPDLPIDDVKTMDERVSKSLAQPRFQSFLLALFAALALILTAVGLYGVIAYSVAQRTHEIGTRMALGAQQLNILKLVAGEGMVLAALGTALGLAVALMVSRAMESLLYEVAPFDPLTLAAVSVLVFVVALAASIIPAVRAANVDPMIALRYE